MERGATGGEDRNLLVWAATPRTPCTHTHARACVRVDVEEGRPSSRAAAAQQLTVAFPQLTVPSSNVNSADPRRCKGTLISPTESTSGTPLLLLVLLLDEEEEAVGGTSYAADDDDDRRVGCAVVAVVAASKSAAEVRWKVVRMTGWSWRCF